MPTSGYDVIALMAERLVAEGCSPAQVAAMEAQAVNMLAAAHRAKREEAERVAAALLHTGAAQLAERWNCHRSTVYRRAARCRTRVLTDATS